jgi:hypothetical protein
LKREGIKKEIIPSSFQILFWKKIGGEENQKKVEGWRSLLAGEARLLAEHGEPSYTFLLCCIFKTSISFLDCFFLLCCLFVVCLLFVV